MSDNDVVYLEIGNIRIDRLGWQVYCCGQLVELTCLQFNLFIYLFDNANIVCNYDELLKNVWKYDPYINDWYVVRLGISRLKKSFQNCLHCQGASLQIRTIRSVGYCLDTRKSSSQTFQMILPKFLMPT